MLKTLCVFGTRPEAIKMAPLIKKFESERLILNKVCSTGQHSEMIYPVLDFFGIVPDYDLKVMSISKNLSELTSNILLKLTNILDEDRPNLILVHGDTTTTLAASLAAYYHKIPLGHVEAGLRTGDIYSPWPEEINRRFASLIATMHFSPTSLCKDNLISEGVKESTIYITGNTVIDALHETCRKFEFDENLKNQVNTHFSFLNKERRLILVTCHRRENFGEGFLRICRALIQIAEIYPEVDIVYPVHLNPNISEPVKKWLKNLKNVYLIPPLDYLSFVYLMNQSYLILTDSGGIQEEAPSLKKPVIVMREKSERMEAVKAGTVRLVGTDIERIVFQVKKLLSDQDDYQAMTSIENPYGDGKAADRILNTIKKVISISEKKESSTREVLV